jgi:hypothetical protein
MHYDGYVKVAPRIFEEPEKEIGPDVSVYRPR